MKTKAMVKGLGLALATCAGLGLAGQANADVYAVSKIDIVGLAILFSGDIVGDDGAPASVGPTAYEFSSDASATLNNVAGPGAPVTCTGNFSTGTTTCGDGTLGPVLSGVVANAPGGDTDRVEDTFNVISEAGGEFSNAESAIITSTLTSPTGELTDVSAISESNLVTGTVAAADTTTQSRTSIDVEFILSGDDGSEVTILFGADWLQAARLTAPDATGGSTSTLSFLTSLTGTSGLANGYEAVWNPGASFGGFGCSNGNCMVNAEAGDLNQVVTTDQQGAPQMNDGAGFFAATFSGLETGTYSLSLTTGTSTLVSRQDVPLPGTLLLMGAGLLAGAGFSSRKKA